MCYDKEKPEEANETDVVRTIFKHKKIFDKDYPIVLDINKYMYNCEYGSLEYFIKMRNIKTGLKLGAIVIFIIFFCC